MFINADLTSHLESSSTVEIEAVAISEINMNIANNIKVVGNYKNRPSGTAIPAASTFAAETSSTSSPQYYGYTDSDIVVDGGYNSADLPLSFISNDKKKNLLFSLEDCFLRFRPRSGINKAMYYGSNLGHFTHNVSTKMMKRPRYYMAHKNDPFKYWTSFRTESEVVTGSQQTAVERGISNTKVTDKSEWYIDDAAPFIVYNNPIPVNRIILKIQTHIGTDTAGNYFDGNTSVSDPLYNPANKSVPMTWKVQYLDANGTSWTTAKSFTYEDVFQTDGYLELHYAPSGWLVKDSTPTSETLYLNELVNPTVVNLNSGKYEQFQYIRGLRIVVDTMSKKDATFDLIELSPRLACDLSNIVSSYSVNKIASDLNTSGLPVGDLLASTGSLEIADFDQALNVNNQLVYSNTGGTGAVANPTGSVIASYLGKDVQIKLYEVVKNVEITEDEVTSYTSFYVPVKTLYIDNFPEINKDTRIANIALRDLFFYFETLNAPELFIKDVSFSYAIAMLFDSIGFSNYVYYKSVNDQEPSIPFFYSSPNTTVAEVLQQLARSTQTAMFFNEDNNLVMMSKSYMLPEPGDRNPQAPEDEVNKVLYGSDNLSENKLADIESISEQNRDILNDGKILYTSRYIQKSYSELRQAQMIDEDKVWNYKPALLWEVAPTDTTKSINEEKYSQSSYTLSAIPLNSSLNNVAPTVDSNGVIQNNVMDLGEGVYWVSRYNGYFYSRGEIIRYDAVEYSIPGVEVPNVWISSREEYQKYFAEIPFGGRLYPTGRVRIYVEPKYNSDGSFKTGEVEKHGRAQFGTQIATHPAGLESYWTNNSYVRGIRMQSYRLFQVDGLIDNVYIKTTVVKIDALAAAGTKKLTVVAADKSIPFASSDTKYQIVLGYDTNQSAIAPDTKIVAYNKNTRVITLDKALVGPIAKDSKISIKEYQNDYDVSSQESLPEYNTSNKAGYSSTYNTLSSQSIRSSIIRNFLSSEYLSENRLNGLTSTQSGTVQSSALVVSGPTIPTEVNPLDHVSYIYKQTNDAYKHFGTRVRVLGTPQNDSDNSQIPTGSSQMFSLTSTNSSLEKTVSGSSGGIGIMVNPDKNFGYYFEIVALTTNNFEGYIGADQIANVFFYKTVHQKDAADSDPAIPVKLWAGLTKILVDDGMFTGQYRFKADKNPTVYDLAVEYEIISDKVKKFYLYINNRLVGTVYDEDSLPVTNNMAIFVRGESRLMFENLFAIGSTGPQYFSDAPLRGALELNKENETDEGIRKYMMPDPISASYLSGLSPIAPPKQSIYFEEFGTIMRECAYFNVKYNKAYPALLSKIAPTFNKLKGYAVSGYQSGAYGAEFMIFNTTDTTLSLEESSGNYLRILGVTFTQESQNEYTVDDHFLSSTDFSNVDENYNGNLVIAQKETYQKIKNSRMTYGKKQFTISADYIQDQDSAKSLMSWLLKKVTGIRRAIGVEIFPNPTIQLGDIVTINYKRGGIDQVTPETSRFVVYNIQYKRDGNGPKMTLYLTEVSDAQL